jgi:hypothetical protein
MSQEDKPRFSHITVGQAKADDLPYAEEEEVIAIGAVDTAVADVEVPVSPDARAEGFDDIQGDNTNDKVMDAMDGVDSWVDESKPTEESLLEQGFTEPMPTAQKLVFAACFIGLICVIAYLTWFWVTQR